MSDQIAEKLDRFFGQFRKLSFKKGQILLSPGEDPRGIFYLKSGFIRQYTISQKGEDLIVNIFKPIAFFPLSWAIHLRPNEYFYEATTDVVVWKAPVDKTLEFLQSNPDVQFDLISRIYNGLDGLLRRMTYLMAGNAYSRLIAELLIYSKRFGEDTSNVHIKISEKELGAQAGLTRETVSREIKKLKDKKLVEVINNHLSIPNVQRLEEELSQGV